MNGLEVYRDNRNPYHDYSDISLIEKEALPLFDGVELPDLYRPGESKIIPVQILAKKFYGFNTCKDKTELQNGYSFPSKIWKGEVRERLIRKDARLKKDGTPYPRKKGNPVYDPESNTWVYKTCQAVMEFITEDIQSFWLFLAGNRQVSSGLTHMERRVLVCDFDDDPLKDGTLEDLEIICSSNNIPHFTYLERHMDNDHFQIGWILDRPFQYPREQSVFCGCIHKLADLFGSDPAFTGWNIKNPCNCSPYTDTLWFNDKVSREDMVSSLLVHNYTASQPIQHTVRHSTAQAVESGSREISLFNELRSWYDGQDWPETLQKAKELSVSISKRLNKPDLTDSEISKQAKSVYDWHKKNHTVSKKQKLGNLVSSCKKERDALKSYLEYLKHPGRKVHPYITGNMDLINRHKWSSLIPSVKQLKKMNISKYAPLIKETESLLDQVRKKQNG